MSSLEDYLRVAWQDHAARPRSVVDSFPEGLARLGGEGDAKFPDLARLIEHTLLAHLGTVGQLRPWIDRLQACAPDLAAARVALQRMAFADEVSHGTATAAPVMADDQQLSACANGLVAHCVAGDGTAALRWLVQYAQELCHTTRSRAKAIAGAMNSLSFHLSLFQPDGVAREVMVASAVLSRDAWSRLGSWRDVERAEHFLALTHVAAGHGRQALIHVERCLALCEQHRAPAYEFAMAEDARARAALLLDDGPLYLRARQRMEQWLADVGDPAGRAHALSRLQELDAMRGPPAADARIASPA